MMYWALGASLAAALFGWLLWGQIEKNGEMKAELVKATVAIEALNNQRQQDQRALDALNEKYLDAAAQIDVVQAELDKERRFIERNILENPYGAGTRATDDLNELMRGIYEAAGGREGRAVPSAPTGPAAATGHSDDRLDAGRSGDLVGTD